MAIPHVFLPVRPQDFSVTPFRVHKRYVISNTDYSASGYTYRQGVYTSTKTPISSSKANNDPRNPDGSYQHIIWQSLFHRYYRYPYDPVAGGEQTNDRYTYKQLWLSCSLVSVPYMDMGEGIKPGSVRITGSTSGIYLHDDGHGNLYDSSIDTGSMIGRNNLALHLSFNEAFKATKYGRPGTGITKFRKPVRSFVFTPEVPYTAYNTILKPGPTDSLGTFGHSIEVSGSSWVYWPHHRNINFDSSEDFSLSLFISPAVAGQLPNLSGANTIVSKRGTIRKLVYGTNPRQNANGLRVSDTFVSQSLENTRTSVYPYHLEIENASGSVENDIVFKRSDGVNTVLLRSSALGSGSFKNVTVVKSARTMYLYVDGVLESSGSDTTNHPINSHDLILAAEDLNARNGFRGKISEFKIYNRALTAAEVSRSVGPAGIAQTAVVGNVFYRGGDVVITSKYPEYHDVFASGSWQMAYRNTHMIYQNEVLCRIKKGSANMSQNPTARQSPNSDMFINDMTSSLLQPYATGIGLYNSRGEMVAIAKLGQPLQMRDDTDVNIMIRWDM